MFKLSRRLITALIVCLTVPLSPALADVPLSARLLTVLEDYHAANPTSPGVVVRVASPSRGLDWSSAIGNAGGPTEVPLSTDHTFRIASNAKTYVAAAILRLTEEGLLSLDDSLGKHLPTDQYDLLAGDGYDLDTMTIGQVLAHTSGLAEHPADPRYEEAILADPHHRWTRLEQVSACVEWQDPVGPPGEQFSYSDTGYILLGGIIEQKTGHDLGLAVRELLGFEKLGLDVTWWEIFEARPAEAGPRAHQYYGDLDTFDWDPSLDLYGGGGLISDARDLGLFMRLLLEGKVLHQEASLAAMTGRGTPDYRLGIFCTDFGEYLAWGHTGFWNTFAFYVPELDLTVSGSILNHHAEKGQELAKKLVGAVARERDSGLE